MSFEMYVPTRIVFGAGALNRLHEQTLPGKAAMLVISNGRSSRENGSLRRITEELAQAGASFVLFDRVEANPLQSTVMAGAAFARKNGCDFIVALGGGSVMDAAKAMAFMATNPGELWDYIRGGTGKGKPMEKKPLPVVCVTTTAGTGSEADQWGVITNEASKEKIGFGGWDELYPALSIVDPELMLSVPSRLTAYQGFDAFFHSVECYISKAANLLSDMYALTAIENIAAYLPRAVADGGDISARERVAFANTLSGVVMTLSSCTSEHSMEHAMSAYHQELPHGAGLIMISQAYYAYFIGKGVCGERFVRMAQAMGMSRADKPEDFLSALAKLRADCGVDGLKMSDFGISREECEALAANARETMGGLFAADPAEMTHEDCVSVFKNAYR